MLAAVAGPRVTEVLVGVLGGEAGGAEQEDWLQGVDQARSEDLRRTSARLDRTLRAGERDGGLLLQAAKVSSIADY